MTVSHQWLENNNSKNSSQTNKLSEKGILRNMKISHKNLSINPKLIYSQCNSE
jgi:hypothetical protein